MTSSVCSYALLLLLGIDLSATVEFRIGFTRWPEWEVVGVPGSSLSLPCATNVSAEKISWQFNHHFLLSPPSPSPVHHDPHLTPSVAAPFDVREVEDGSELVVHLAERESQYKHQLGLYQCVAWFGAVALTSLPGRLRAALMEPYPEEEEAGRVELEVEEGQSVRVECGLPHSIPEAQVTFYKDNQPLTIQNSTGYHVTPHGDLVMGNVGAWAAGEYTCSAHNPVLNRTVRRNTRTRVVVVRPTQRTQPSPPHYITLGSTVYTGTVGSNVTLLCLANGHPKPRLRWSKYGGTLSPSSIQMEDGSLSITGLRVEDEGTYLCHADNGLGGALNVLDMLLEVLDPPQLIEGPASQEVEEGSSASLTCIAHGHPAPKVMWVFNGRLVRNDTNILITENRLRIAKVEKEHAGIFQCFVHNPQGTVQKLAVIRVVPQTVTVAPNGTNHRHASDRAENRKWNNGHEVDGMGGTRVPGEGKRIRNQTGRSKHRGTGRRKGEVDGGGESSTGGVKKGKKKKGRMFPPSRPRIAKVSDESVMVSWDDPRQAGLLIMFYKIQYKAVRSRGNRGSHWMTVDEDIPPHIHSFEVTGLQTGRTYKFRMAAVYSNNDNMLGHTSRRFLLEKSQRLQPPATPTITSLEPKGPSAVTLMWQYDAASDTSVEGFFINYREATKAGDYTKVTVLGPSKREVLVSHLKANVSYDFKIQAFNLAGASDFSPVYKKNVIGPVISTGEESGKEEVEEENNLTPVVRSGDPAVSNMQLYIILGAVVGVLLLIVVISAAAYSCRHSHINDDTRSAKYEDTSLHIHREASTYSLPDDHRRNGRGHNGYLPHQGITVTPQDTDKVAMESSLIENNNHNIQDVERCYASPARRIASEDSCELKSVGLIRNSHSNFDVGIREAPRT